MRLSWGTRSRSSFVVSERSTRISGPTSRAGFRGSRPGEPHDAGIIRDADAAAGGAWYRARREMARSERFELPTLGIEIRCSIQLSYERTSNSNRLAGVPK